MEAEVTKANLTLLAVKFMLKAINTNIKGTRTTSTDVVLNAIGILHLSSTYYSNFEHVFAR